MNEAKLKVEVPNLVQSVVSMEAVCSSGSKDLECCDNCKHFVSSTLAWPGGWCKRVPSFQVNVGANDFCNKFERSSRTEQGA